MEEKLYFGRDKTRFRISIGDLLRGNFYRLLEEKYGNGLPFSKRSVGGE